MPNYRVYCYGRNQALWVGDCLVATDDQEAICVARSLKNLRLAEVWQGQRFVGASDRADEARDRTGSYRRSSQDGRFTFIGAESSPNGGVHARWN